MELPCCYAFRYCPAQPDMAHRFIYRMISTLSCPLPRAERQGSITCHSERSRGIPDRAGRPGRAGRVRRTCLMRTGGAGKVRDPSLRSG